MVSSLALFVICASVGLVGGWLSNVWVHSIVEAADGEYAIEVAPTCTRCGLDITTAAVAPWRLITEDGRQCGTCAEDLDSSWYVYPLVCAAVCGASALILGPAPILPSMMLLCIIGIAAAATDIRTMLIPKKLAWGGLAVGASAVVATSVWMWLDSEEAFEPYLAGMKWAAIGAALYLGLFFVISVLSPAGLGMGDVRLAAVLGLYLGWVNIRLVMWGILLGSVAGLIVGLASRRWSGRKEPYPYGPGMVVGAVVAIWLNGTLLGA